jgi:hypothetical protein
VNRAALLVAIFACSSCRPDSDAQRVVVKDNAMLCMGVAVPDADGGKAHAELRAGQTLPVVVRSLGCLSDACATKRQATCTAKREGNRIVVTSELTWLAPEEIDRPCPGSCSMLDATCSVGPLQPGKYTVVHGAKTIEVDVPSEIESGCVDAQAAAKANAMVVTPADAAAPVIAPLPSAVAATAAPPPTGGPVIIEAPPETICVASLLPKGKQPKAVPLGIAVTRPNKCAGASCSGGTAKCTAKRKGSIITVNATFPSATGKPRVPCTDDCKSLVASCKTDPIPSGTYTIQVGGHAEEFSLPAQSICKP